MRTNWQMVGAICAFLGVALGAFGAHGLEHRLTPHLLEVFKTGAYYQMVHAIALVSIGTRHRSNGADRSVDAVCLLFTLGIVIFSGSLYTLSITGNALWGAVTPFGGLCFLSGWAMLAAASARSGSRDAIGDPNHK